MTWLLIGRTSFLPSKMAYPGQDSSSPELIIVTIDSGQDIRPISPLIYGMAFANPAMLRDLRLASNRWGGNHTSRYNWEKGNCWNAARDWEFRNGNYGNTSPADRLPSGVADRFVAETRAAGAAALMTIPAMGYVAKDDNNNSCSVNVPKIGGPPISPGSEAIAGYDPAENQARTSIRSYPRKRAAFQDPPDLADNAVYQDEWVAHFVRKFGTAKEGGVRFYAIDNEPDLWHSTHTDVHPVSMDYEGLLSCFLEYAAAIKAVDPTAEVTGPVSWGWNGYFYSPRDGNNFTLRPDRRAHGDMPFIPWFLDQVRRHDQRVGKRTLDVLDIHYYPQAPGVYEGKTDPDTEARRLRSTRSLWDPSYKDESWIKDTVMLIPRMKRWIMQYYPGTKLALTEWNWGAGRALNGGLAVAECLGILGREGVYLANYWTVAPVKSPAYFAFKIYRNADGKGNGFGDISIRATSSAPERVSCFGSLDRRSGVPVVILINKQPDGETRITLRLRHNRTLTQARIWQYGRAHLDKILELPTRHVERGMLSLRLPGYSIALIRFK
jgi:hypothetical protein